MTRIVLSERDFADLVTRNQVDKEGVTIILDNIGFLRMRVIIELAEQRNVAEAHTVDDVGQLLKLKPQAPPQANGISP